MATPLIAGYSRVVSITRDERELRERIVAPVIFQLALLATVILLTLFALYDTSAYLEMLALQTIHLFLWPFVVPIAFGVMNSGLYVAYAGLSLVQIVASGVSVVWRIVLLRQSSHTALLSGTQLFIAYVLLFVVVGLILVDLITLVMAMRINTLGVNRVRAIRASIASYPTGCTDIIPVPVRVYRIMNSMYTLLLVQLFLFYGAFILVLLGLWDVFLCQFPVYLQVIQVFQWVFLLALAVGVEQPQLFLIFIIVFSAALLLQLAVWVIHLFAILFSDIGTVQYVLAWILLAADTGLIIVQLVILSFTVTLMQKVQTHTRFVRAILADCKERMQAREDAATMVDAVLREHGAATVAEQQILTRRTSFKNK